MLYTVLLSTLIPVCVLGAPELQFDFGRVQGIDEQAQDTLQPYYAYYGIPFAEPPIGNRRFEPPVPFQGRGVNSVISSSTFKPACEQPGNVNPAGTSEDCLYLNVFTPNDILSNGTRKKVMVWIHGGGFTTGDTSGYVPSRLVTDYDVIVVTVQYRLGILGFLSSGRGDGNYGLLDNIEALRWVKTNIARFGGDENDVTLFGQSAGSAGVSLLAMSPLTKGLFTKAILQSGVAFSAFWGQQNPGKQLPVAAAKVGCDPGIINTWFNTSDQALDAIISCIKTQPVNDLLALYAEGFIFAPVIDGSVIPQDPLALGRCPRLMRESGLLDRDYIVGFNNNEGLLFTAMSGGQAPNTSLDSAGPSIANAIKEYFPYLNTSGRVFDLVDYEYSFPRINGQVPVEGLLNVQADVSFVMPSINFVRALTKASNKTNVYLYLFDHYPQQSQPGSELKGSNHGLELIFEFDPHPYTTNFQSFYANIPTSSDQPLNDIVRGTFSSFAKTGSPTLIGSAAVPSWPRYDSTNENYLAIGVQPVVRHHVFAKRVALWTEVLPKVIANMGNNERLLF